MDVSIKRFYLERKSCHEKKESCFVNYLPQHTKFLQFKQRTIRNTYDFFSSDEFSRTKSSDLLPVSHL